MITPSPIRAVDLATSELNPGLRAQHLAVDAADQHDEPGRMSRRRDGLRQHRVRFDSTRVDELERDQRAAAADVPRSVGRPPGRCGDGSRPARLWGDESEASG